MNRFLSSALVLLVVSVAATRSWAVGYAFTNIADSTTAAPSGAFLNFGVPSISGGNVAFHGSYINFHTDVETSSGIFAGSGGPLTTIVKSGDAAPSGTFSSSAFNESATISGTTVAFSATYSGGNGAFTGDGGPLTTIAKNGDAAPSNTLLFVYFAPSISGHTVALAGGLRNDKKVILTGDGGPLEPIVTTGDAAPTGTFGFKLPFGAPAISSGTVAFHGIYSAGSGLFSGSGGALTTIVKTGDPAPSGTFSAFSDPSISGTKVAFSAGYSGGNGGIFVGEGGALTTVARTGDAAPTGVFSNMGSASIGGSETAFLGTYDGLSHRGIFLGDGGPLSKVIATGDSLFGSLVVGLRFGRFGFDPGGSGNLAFIYSLADGRGGVAMASLVPEPNTVVLFCVSLWCFVSAGRAGHRIRLQSGN